MKKLLWVIALVSLLFLSTITAGAEVTELSLPRKSAFYWTWHFIPDRYSIDALRKARWLVVEFSEDFPEEILDKELVVICKSVKWYEEEMSFGFGEVFDGRNRLEIDIQRYDFYYDRFYRSETALITLLLRDMRTYSYEDIAYLTFGYLGVTRIYLTDTLPSDNGKNSAETGAEDVSLALGLLIAAIGSVTVIKRKSEISREK